VKENDDGVKTAGGVHIIADVRGSVEAEEGDNQTDEEGKP